jgi:hypothetical protein
MSNSNEAESQGSHPGATTVRAAGRWVDALSRTSASLNGDGSASLNGYGMATPQGWRLTAVAWFSDSQ